MKKITVSLATVVASFLVLSSSNAPNAVANDAPVQTIEQALNQLDPTLNFRLGICNDPIEMADCMNCNPRKSTGKCKNAQQCTSSRRACLNAGCKITGTASCSTAANVKKCSP